MLITLHLPPDPPLFASTLFHAAGRLILTKKHHLLSPGALGWVWPRGLLIRGHSAQERLKGCLVTSPAFLSSLWLLSHSSCQHLHFLLQTSVGLNNSYEGNGFLFFCQFRGDSVTLGSFKSGYTSLSSSCIKTFLEHHHCTYFIFARTLKVFQYCCLENPMDRGPWSIRSQRMGTRLAIKHPRHPERYTNQAHYLIYIFRTVSDISFIKSILFRDSLLSVQWLRLHASCRGHMFKPSWRNEDPACLVEQPKNK